jgi:tetratricopeptide (TPR) repeat protein
MSGEHAPVMPRRAAWLAAFAACVASVSVGSAGAQNVQNVEAFEVDVFQPTAAETEAWQAVAERKFVAAREKAQAILKRDAGSFIGHMTLGFAYHYAESDLPRALFHLDRAHALFQTRFEGVEKPDAAWRWHAVLLEELASVHGEMEHHAERLAYIARYNELYDPDMIAERAWPLMKLGRYQEAHLAADLGIASGRQDQRTIALNALCAIEFEAGNDGASYQACEAAVDDAVSRAGLASAVDLTNLAEAARSVFKLDVAERLSLDATEAPVSWYGNPWMELADLFVREARFGEALDALKRVPEYRLKRPPHVRDADRNEVRRVIASFLLLLSRAEDASDLTGRALAAPERRAHNSRDPAQDRVVIALLDRRARLVAVEQRMEHAATEPWHRWPLAWVASARDRFEAWRSGALANRLVAHDDRLVGSFRIGTASAAIMPPWLAGELVGLVGAGVAEEALARARAVDRRPAARGYYDAVATEVAWQRSDLSRALASADRALAAVGQAEVVLRARVHAIAADAAQRLGQRERAVTHYDAALQTDPGTFRRLGIPLAVTFRASGGAVATEVASMLARSPRFRAESSKLSVSVQADKTGGKACLGGGQGQVIACSKDTRARTTDDTHDLAARIAQKFLEQAFVPPVDLTQADITSLDGGNLVERGALDTLFR